MIQCETCSYALNNCLCSINERKMVDREIVKFCSIEAILQMSGELSVGWMVDAWIYAQENCGRLPTVNDVLEIGKLVEPVENAKGFRTCGVQIGHEVKMDWHNIPRQMVDIIDAVREKRLNAAEFFKAYEECHPFRDGNGRSGVLLGNWIGGTLDHPIWMPNYWNDIRRTIGFGAS